MAPPYSMREKMKPKVQKYTEAIIRENFHECVEELLEWTDTGTLRDGCIRKVAAEWADAADSTNPLNIARNQIVEIALRSIADGRNKKNN